jgi:hypothetical protein
MAVINSPFKSKFGFTSAGFIVDNLGNISAKSINLIDSTEVDDSLPADYIFTEVSSKFRNSLGSDDNPTITVFRGKTTTIDITLTSLEFRIVLEDRVTPYSAGLSHNDGTTGADSQGKSSGRLAWAVPVAAPDTLYYANAVGTVSGTINIENAPSVFSSAQVTATTASTSSSTGALTVAGGVGIAGDLYIGGTLNIDGLGITDISSPTDLQLGAANAIIVKIDGTTLGVVTTTGSSVPVVNTTINNTVIGATTPNSAAFTSAAFTSATIVSTPVSATDVSNKQYVDSTALSLSIAFGL